MYTSNRIPRPKSKGTPELERNTPIKLDNFQKTFTNGIYPNTMSKSNSVRIVKVPDNITDLRIVKNDGVGLKGITPRGSKVIQIKAPSSGTKSQSSFKKPFIRVPGRNPAKKNDSPDLEGNSSMPPIDVDQYDEIKDSSQHEDEDQTLEPLENSHKDFSSRYRNKAITLCSTMESSTQIPKTKLTSLNNLNLSEASPMESNNNQNSEISSAMKDTLSRNFNETPKASPTKSSRKYVRISNINKKTETVPPVISVNPIVQTNNIKCSKTMNKFADAMEKAKVYNDQVVLQHQFDVQNEEEERDFNELYELLQYNIKE